MRNPTTRFSDRVEFYVKYRPGYPPELMDYLLQSCELAQHSVVADVGSGTGILTRMLLAAGLRVLAVEPNLAMRKAAERALSRIEGFHSVDGTAEATGLRGAGVDCITVAQAFHWFDVEPTRREFARILTPGGRVLLVWNRRRDSGSAFLAAYEEILKRYGTDYGAVDHRKTVDGGALDAFFGPGRYESAVFDNRQVLDWAGVRGRILSSSYAPMPDHPSHEPLMREMRRAFDAAERNGTVSIDYDTEVYCGRLGRGSELR